jgi:hypothetical protein
MYVTANAAETWLSELTYGNGKTFRTDLGDAQLLGQLNIPGREPILFFSGRPRARCSGPDCDSANSVYHQWAADGPNMWSGTSLHYPGDYYDSDSRRLLAHVRMFLGQCVDSREVAVWFTEAVDESAAQRDSMLRTRTEVDFVLDLPNMPTPDSPMLGTQFPDHLDISIARSAVAKHICREVPPSAKLYTTSTAYVVQPPQFRSDCTSPTPIRMPLGPGQPGKPLAYRDKQTNILLYVESDGRHLAAVSSEGALLWVRDPFAERNLCPYRSARPIVVYVGPTRAGWSGDEASFAKQLKLDTHLIEIQFDSSQFGVVDIKNGDFYFGGQN